MRNFVRIFFLLSLVWLAGCQSVPVKVDPIKLSYPADTEKRYVFAHYVIWYGTPDFAHNWRHWEWNKKPHRRYPERTFPDGRRDIAGVHYPVIGPYDSSDEALLEYHILLAKAAGIDGFMVNWYGAKDEFGNPRYEDVNFRKLLKIAEQYKFQVCINFEDKSMFPPFQRHANRKESVAAAKKSVRKICSKYGSSPAYFKINSRPVVTNFGWQDPNLKNERRTSFSASEWKTILNKSGSRKPYFIANHHWHWGKRIFETGFLNVAESIYPWVSGGSAPRLGFYKDSARAQMRGRLKMVSGQVCPGFDSYGTWGWGEGRVRISRKDGERYKSLWEECFTNGVKWIQIISWNDFAEGTTIEPTRDYGYDYLELTSNIIAGMNKQTANYRALRIPEKIYRIHQQLTELSDYDMEASLLASLRRDRQLAVGMFLQKSYGSAAKLVETLSNRVAVEYAKIEAEDALTISIEPAELEMEAGESRIFTVTAVNNNTEPVEGRIVLDTDRVIPKQWFNSTVAKISLAAGGRQTVSFTLKAPAEAGNRQALLEAQLYCGGDFKRSPVSKVRVVSRFFHADLGPRNVLTLNKEIKVSLTLQNGKHDFGEILLEAPRQWKVRPEKISYDFGDAYRSVMDFYITATDTQKGVIQAKIKSKHYGNHIIAEPFQTTQPGQVVLFHGDLNNDGARDFVLANDRIEVQVATNLGGRIIGFFFNESGSNQLYMGYPCGDIPVASATGEWAEYGGINDTFPKNWPGDIWNDQWKFRILKSTNHSRSLLMSSKSRNGLYLQRTLILKSDESAVGLQYVVANKSSGIKRFSWSNHPDLAVGPSTMADSSNQIIVPTKSGLVKEPFSALLDKLHYKPSKNWCLALDKDSQEYFAQRWHGNPVKKIGVWQGNDFYTMELIFKEFSVKPGKSKRFKLEYMTGKGDWKEAVR
ncbi:hypothetical protein K8S19_10170 [bacterium]|nr:hypothetical protein [bacterium]